MKKLLTISTIALCIVSFQPAHAEDSSSNGADLSKTMPRDDYKNMTDEQRQQFHEQRKTKWDSMSKEDKLQMIEKRRTEKKSKMEEKWGSMSDDEKIGFVEKRMQKRSEHKGGEHVGHEKVAE